MPFDPTNLILENLVIKSRLELPLPGARGRDVHGRLAAAEDHKGFLGGEGGCVEGGVAGIGLQRGEVARRGQLGGFVFGGRDEVGAVWGHLEIGHLHVGFVGWVGVEEFAGLVERGCE